MVLPFKNSRIFLSNVTYGKTCNALDRPEMKSLVLPKLQDTQGKGGTKLSCQSRGGIQEKLTLQI